MATKSFRRTFLTGLIIVLPAWVTLWIISLIFGLFAGAVTPLVHKLIQLVGLSDGSEAAWVRYVAPVVSVALSFLTIYLVGLIGGNVLGRQLIAAIDRLLLQVPFVRGIYKATRQFFDTFAKPRGFNRVVLVEYPRQGLWTLALVTGTPRGEVQRQIEGSVISIFVPTTPNPTSGFLLFVDEREVVPLAMSVEDALKMIVSGGVVNPGEPAETGVGEGLPSPQ
jgi:uncharacterized membrane protein